MLPLTQASCKKCSSPLSTETAAKAGYRYRAICKPCHAAYMRGWNTLNRDKVRERNRRYKIDKPQQYKDSKLRTNFGIGLARYEEMLAAQNGLCAACGGENQVAHRRLAVDHCHRTGRMRALLCGNCNTAIGLVHESVDRLNALITYLRTHENG